MTNTQQSVRKTIPKINNVVEAYAYLGSNQTALTGNSWNKINLNTVLYDAGKNFDTALHKFVVPVAGLYSIKGVVHFTSVTVDIKYMTAIYKNGVAIKYAYQHAALVADVSVLAETEVFLEENDYIELFAQPAVGTNGVAAVSSSEYTSLITRLITKEGIRQ